MNSIKKKLKPKWELFCQYYVGDYETFGNATQSYAKAYGKDLNNKAIYASCRTQGYRLLTNNDILDRINQLLVELVMNNTSVDAELGFLIMQRVDFGSKIQAIREYNKLKQRITDKLDVRVNAVDKILEKYGLSNAREAEEAKSRSSTNSKQT